MSASTTASCPILTYHSQLLFGSDYANNSHVALKDDLARVAASGRRIVPLPQLVEALAGRAAMPDLDRVVCISFDDGPDFDWLDIDHPEHGPQPGFARILREHWAAHPEASPVAASSFVIADASARTAISRSAMDGHDWMHDHWWRAAQDSGLLAIESHGWDHRHEALGEVQSTNLECLEKARQGDPGNLWITAERQSTGKGSRAKQILVSVKSGHNNVAHVRDLVGVITREDAAIGVLICLEQPTAPMRREAASAGFYEAPWGTKHPKIQILTIADLMDGKGIDYPRGAEDETFQRAARQAHKATERQGRMDL